MARSVYASFLLFALVLILVPVPDFAVVTRNALVRRAAAGVRSAVSVASAATVQGTAAATGLRAVIAGAQPVLAAVK